MAAKIGITPEDGAHYCNPLPYAGPRTYRSGERSKPPVDVAQA